MNVLVNTCFAALLSTLAFGAFATGAQPDTTIVMLSESDGQAQMGVRNTDDGLIILSTTVMDLSEEDESLMIHVWPPVARLEANGRQVIRFVLDKSSPPLKVQALKRVSFEGIPPRSGAPESENAVRVNVRTTLPMVISPKGLKQIDNPWTKLVFSTENGQLKVHNPSPFVVRLQAEVDLIPMMSRIMLFASSYVLPGQTFTAMLPMSHSPDAYTGVRIFPASPWGYSAGAYDVAFGSNVFTRVEAKQ